MNRSHILLALIVVGVALSALTAFSQQSTSSTKTSKTSNKAVEEITLPEIASDPAPGPNLQIYQQKCLLCHSNRYVAMQPNFSRTVWEKEVKKMVDAYGAPIPANEQQEIVEYLVAIKGPEGR